MSDAATRMQVWIRDRMEEAVRASMNGSGDVFSHGVACGKYRLLEELSTDLRKILGYVEED